MVKKIGILSLVVGLACSPLTATETATEAATDFCFKGDKPLNTVDLLSDAVEGEMDVAINPMLEMIALADQAEDALENKIDGLEVHIKSKMLKSLNNSINILSFIDADDAAALIEEAAKISNLDSRVLLDLIKKSKEERGAYIQEMIDELGQAKAMLQEIVALKKSIMATLSEEAQEALEELNA